MKSYTLELVFNGSAQLLPNITVSSFTNFLPEQLNLEGHWEVAISEKPHPTMYQTVTEWKLMFFDKKVSKSSEFHYLEPSFYPPVTDIVEAMNTLIQERHNQSESCITVKASQRKQKLRFTFQMKDQVLHSLVTTWDISSAAMLANNLEWSCE